MKTTICRRTFLALSLLLSVAAGGHAFADDGKEGDDHERAFSAVESGKARPLVDILEEVHRQLQGDVVGVEFERLGGRYVYEFKVVSASGRLREVYVDALTAEILREKDD